jgi:NADH:ubiquinone oxidoreductase subunit F (NADH-binding)
MPRLRMLTALANPRNSWEMGEELNASPEEAQVWVAAGIAEYVTGEEALTPERRMQALEVRRGPGRPRKHPR